MSNIKQSLLRLTKLPRKYLSFLMECGLLNNMDDEKYLKIMWLIRMGYPLDLNNPRTFNEKLQWLKLHDHNPQYTIMADKYEAKKFIAERVGEEYVVPNYGVWDSFDAIDFDALPDQFVLKTTHDNDSQVIVKNKLTFNREAAKKRLESHLKRNHYYNTREWAYKNIKPQIIAEKLLENSDNSELLDYKVSCFNGEPQFTYIQARTCNDPNKLLTNNDNKGCFKFSQIKLEFKLRRYLNDIEIITYYDNNYNIIPCSNSDGPSLAKPDPKPITFDKMLELSRILSKDIPHVRVDFYEVDGKLYVGELTFYTSAGFAEFTPDEYNYKFGDMITLPEPNA